MMMRRIAEALRNQEWTTILIEFVLVVVGVLFALQLDQWRENLAETAEEKQLLRTVLEDVRRDIDDLENSKLSLELVTDFGTTALAALDSGDCIEKCWPTLVAFFHASQWTDVALNKVTYDEMSRAGLPRDMGIKSELAEYYASNRQSVKIFSELPEYRELIRSIIPAPVQQYMWTGCYRVEGRHQYLIADCASPIGEEEARRLVDDIRDRSDVRTTLNFWLSTTAVVTSTLDAQIAGAESVIEVLSAYIEGM